MALDMAKYRKLFLEESAEHLGEISRALLELEKDSGDVESIDVIFRMAHSIKSMAASLGFDSISELSHRLEDRMERIRSASRVEGPDELALLFRGLEGLESLVQGVADSGEAPALPEELLAALAEGTGAAEPILADEPPSAAAAAEASAEEEAGPQKKA